MWGGEEIDNEIVNEIEETKPLFSRNWTLVIWFLSLVLLVYYAYLFCQDWIFYYARIRIMRAQYNHIPATQSEAESNFFAAADYYDKLVRAGL
jgi:hypothetical protein